MDRRQFVATVGSSLLAAGAGKTLAQESTAELKGSEVAPFKSLFATHAGHFGGAKTIDLYLDALKKAYDQGFRAWEDNWLVGRPADYHDKLGELLQEKGMTMGVSVVTVGAGARFSQPTADEQEKILADCKKAVECAQRVGHKWFTLLPGIRDAERPLSEQLEGSVDLLNRCCDIFEEADLIFVMEPISHGLKNKPVLLETFKEGFDLCQLVNRPSCKLLADYYHQQQVGGDLIKNTDECWDEIVYIQYGDVPGRKQPGTGEINYRNITKHLREKGYKGVIGLEHGIKGTSDDLVKAYRDIDA